MKSQTHARFALMFYWLGFIENAQARQNPDAKMIDNDNRCMDPSSLLVKVREPSTKEGGCAIFIYVFWSEHCRHFRI